MKTVNGKKMMIGKINFNEKYLKTYSNERISSTLAHEIGHTLGYGFDIKWKNLFNFRGNGNVIDYQIDKHNQTNAQFKADWRNDIKDMYVELDFGWGCKHSHWDEMRYGKELMTGKKNYGDEDVFRVTVLTCYYMGHQINNYPEWEKTNWSTLYQEAKSFVYHDYETAMTFNRLEDHPMKIREHEKIEEDNDQFLPTGSDQ
eukprot:CAMPEP_0117426762 /NCGR_PEP_ID=MMETSP0758-20121206/6788_1 /TAXON_ID=63605 /ORGANISM="Percolomonas cosmopolitus, Strain AE-1 (ATCC 50343)" /LENGTH=200 /DNA_ID=CAMNT_0005212079 /DNA_START=293 /DNA_END=895 /DNA_ORIENTATION=-